MFEYARALLRDPLRMGSVAPSGVRLAHAIAEEAARSEPRVVLEVGAGSGAITRALRARLHHGAHLVALDIDRRLLRHAHVPGRRVQGDAAHVPLRRADVIVSGIPLGWLPEDDVRAILAALAIVAPRIVLFQYTPRRLALVREFFPGARVVRRVMANVPPAQVVASPA